MEKPALAPIWRRSRSDSQGLANISQETLGASSYLSERCSQLNIDIADQVHNSGPLFDAALAS